MTEDIVARLEREIREFEQDTRDDSQWLHSRELEIKKRKDRIAKIQEWARRRDERRNR